MTAYEPGRSNLPRTDEELVQPAQEAVEETLQVTPSPDLLPIVGVLMLLVSVIRERMIVGRTERYKEVER